MLIRVAHVIASLAVGGAERNLVNLLNAMACDYRAVVCIGRTSASASFYQDLDSGVEQFSVRLRGRSFPYGVLRLASVFRETGVNVVHTHMFGANLYGVLAARIAGVPVIVTSEHGENPWKRSFHRWLERRVISPFVDMRFCVSPRILALRRDSDGVPSSKLKLIVNGTQLPNIEVDGPCNSIPVVGAVGRAITAKDYPRLLKAVAMLRDRGYRLELCIIGDGPEMPKLRQLVDKLGLQTFVRLPGLVTNVSEWYRRFDVYVSSSVREGQPVALLEAMAHAVPVVATDVGASADTVRHGQGGLIVPPEDTDSLADTIGQLLDDTDLRRALGRNARERVKQQYSIDSVAEFHTDLYADLLAKKCASVHGSAT